MSEITRGGGPNRAEAIAFYFERIEQLNGDVNVASIMLQKQEFEEFKEDIIAELRGICPYQAGEEVYVSGMALIPDMDEFRDEDDIGEVIPFAVAILEKDKDARVVYGRVKGTSGVYNGCSIQSHEGEYGKEYRIRHKIVLGNGFSVTDRETRLNEIVLVGHFERDCAIQTDDDLQDALRLEWGYEELSSAQIAEIIDGYSNKFVRLLNDTRFRRLPLAKQRTELHDLIWKAETESRVQDRYVDIAFAEPNDDDRAKGRHKDRRLKTTRHIYTAERKVNTLTMRRKTEIPETLHGMCMGLVSVEQPHVRSRPFRRDTDLVDKYAGLCLAIAPDYETAGAIAAKEHDLIFVPVSGQRFDAEFH